MYGLVSGLEQNPHSILLSDNVGKIDELSVQIRRLDVPHSEKAAYCEMLNSPHEDREHVQRSTPPIAIYQNSKHQTCWRIPKGD